MKIIATINQFSDKTFGVMAQTENKDSYIIHIFFCLIQISDTIHFFVRKTMFDVLK